MPIEKAPQVSVTRMLNLYQTTKNTIDATEIYVENVNKMPF